MRPVTTDLPKAVTWVEVDKGDKRDRPSSMYTRGNTLPSHFLSPMQNGKRGATYPAKLMLFDANFEQGGGKRDKAPGHTMQRRPLSASVLKKDGKPPRPLSAFIRKQKEQTTRIGTAGHLEEKGSGSQDVRSPAGEVASNMHRLKPSAMPPSPLESTQQSSGPRSRFDFSTMEDGALEEQPVKQHRSRLIERKSSRLGSMFKDTWKSFKAYDGSSINLQAVETDDVLGSKLKFGFRSQALKMQVAITEKLRMAEDEASSFQIYKDLFADIIAIDKNFAELLRQIKTVYDAKIELVPTSDSDNVSYAAYEALKTRESALQDRLRLLEEENVRLKDAEGERRAVEERDEVSRIEEEEEEVEVGITTEASNSDSKRGRRLEDVEAELKREREMRLKLQEALQDMMKLQASSDRSPRDPLSSRGSRDSARNTARSAASGYDDHPTHRSVEVARPRPPSVPAISDEEWALVQRQKEEEDAENEAWAAQEGGEGESEYEETSYENMYDEIDLEDEEVEQLMRLHYQRQARSGSEGSEEVETDRSDRMVVRPQR
uniref:Translin-associated factor X-interacting protein 1 N-terminal domain-containing protein n=1 Tax=Guillardia theta TaxID=55529 RepID=A0A7S4NWV4_GUITH|mmetsp:Transcript_36729/g.114659  ORF Transcript_36729/g.114659 Transcript_36729/m.114659 type:complete len:547 (+) Transcript_36729:235-1875(+)